MSSSVTATFVFTDLVGSTALASSVTADDADQLRLIHFGLLRTAVRRHRGEEPG
jgi:class 3 adenylate cyclase